MINIISSTAGKASAGLRKVARKRGEDNLRWISRNYPADAKSVILLFGGVSPASFRLRVAQSHVRHTLDPSSWSHAVLLGRVKDKIGDSVVYEINLEAPQGMGFPPPTNGVQENMLSRYASIGEYPNVALLAVPVSMTEVMRALERFKMQRAVLDAVELMLRWMAFVWGASGAGNPLLENHGIPSAAMLDVVLGAAGFDLTPGLESRASCPEAIWQSAKWWHEYYEKQNLPAITGAFIDEHKLLQPVKANVKPKRRK
jgi:hypothetical protein